MMSEEEFRIRLNKKMKVDIFGIPVRQYTLDEVLDGLGYEKFKYLREVVNTSIDLFAPDMKRDISDYMFEVKTKLMVRNPDMPYDIYFDLFDMCLYVPVINNLFIEFMNTFTYATDISLRHIEESDEMVIFYKLEDEARKLSLDRKGFNELIDLFSVLNFSVRTSKDKYITNSKSVEDFDKKVKEIKDKYGIKDKHDITFESITSALINSENPNYTHESIGNKTMYQIMDSFSRMCKFKDNEFMNLVRVNCSKVDKNEISKTSWFYNIYQ